MADFENNNNLILPHWYKSYILANGVRANENSNERHINGMNDRPFEFVYNAIKLRP